MLRTHDRYGEQIDEIEFHPAWDSLLRLGLEARVQSLPWVDERSGAHVARAALFMLLGQVEAYHGRNLNALQAAFRVGFRVAWNRTTKICARHELPSEIVAGLARARPLAALGISRLGDAPKIEVAVIPSREAPGGVSGLGTVVLAPALANAIHAATGTRLRRLPLDPMTPA